MGRSTGVGVTRASVVTLRIGEARVGEKAVGEGGRGVAWIQEVGR